MFENFEKSFGVLLLSYYVQDTALYDIGVSFFVQKDQISNSTSMDLIYHECLCKLVESM